MQLSAIAVLSTAKIQLFCNWKVKTDDGQRMVVFSPPFLNSSLSPGSVLQGQLFLISLIFVPRSLDKWKKLWGRNVDYGVDLQLSNKYWAPRRGGIWITPYKPKAQCGDCAERSDASRQGRDRKTIIIPHLQFPLPHLSFCQHPCQSLRLARMLLAKGVSAAWLAEIFKLKK